MKSIEVWEIEYVGNNKNTVVARDAKHAIEKSVNSFGKREGYKIIDIIKAEFIASAEV